MKLYTVLVMFDFQAFSHLAGVFTSGEQAEAAAQNEIKNRRYPAQAQILESEPDSTRVLNYNTLYAPKVDRK